MNKTLKYLNNQNAIHGKDSKSRNSSRNLKSNQKAVPLHLFKKKKVWNLWNQTVKHKHQILATLFEVGILWFTEWVDSLF